MATRWRMLHNIDYELPVGVDPVWSYQIAGFRHNAPYMTYVDNGVDYNCLNETGISTKEVVEGQNASLVARVIEEDDIVGAVKIDFALTNVGFEAWQLMHQYEGAYENKQGGGGVAWTMDTFDRMVLWVKPPATWLNTYSIADLEAEYLTNRKAFGCTSVNISGHIRPGSYCENSVTPSDHSDGTVHTRKSLHEFPWNDVGDDPDYDYHGNKYPDGHKQPRGHPYHNFGFLVPGAWNQCILDFNAVWSKDSNNTARHMPYTRYPFANKANQNWCNDTSANWFDGAVHYYFHANELNTAQWPPPVGYGSEWYFGPVTFYEEPHADDEYMTQFICALSGAYLASEGQTGNGTIFVAFEGGRRTPWTFEFVWSYNNLHTSGGWSSGAPFTQHHGSIFGDLPWPPSTIGFFPGDTDNGTLSQRTFWSDEIAPGGPDNCVYIGVRPNQSALAVKDQGNTKFRQICIPFVDGNLPPHLKD